MMLLSSSLKRSQPSQEVSTVQRIQCAGQKINLLGIVLQKTRVRKIENKEGKTSCKGVFSFALRDNVMDWINITYWGTFKAASEMAASFSLGDVVLVIQGFVKEKGEGSYEENFMFQTSSKFSILLNESRGTILPYKCENQTQINKLRTELICPAEYHFTLKQVVLHVHASQIPAAQTPYDCKTKSFEESKKQLQLFNFFAAVANIGEKKSLITNRFRKTNFDMMASETAVQALCQKCEITLIDETCSDFPLVLWNEDLIAFALRMWKANSTVLSIVDCPVHYDNYRCGVVAVPNDKTGIITMPACEEAIRLSQYAKYTGWSPLTGSCSNSLQMSDAGQFTQPMPTAYGRIAPEFEQVDLSAIHTVLTVEDILNGKVKNPSPYKHVALFFFLSNCMCGTCEVNSGYCIVFATLSKLPVDTSEVMRVTRLSCANCHRRLQACEADPTSKSAATDMGTIMEQYYTCETANCQFSGQRFKTLDEEHIVMEYNCFAHLSDHTGTYMRCIFTNTALQKLFTLTAREFVQLSANKRTILKWTLLLRRFKIYFWMHQPTFDQPNPFLNILACEEPNAFEVYSSLKGNMPS